MKKKFTIKETIMELNELSKLLSEAYVFDSAEEEVPAEAPMEEEIPEEEEMLDPSTDTTVDEIRKLALQGIQRYADDVDNEMYQFFKKVWMMADKCLSEKESVEN